MTRQSQENRVLNALKEGPKTTWQLGYELGICCVTKRISELRQQGHVITTSEKSLTKQGPGKRIVTYRLEPKENAGISVHERTEQVVACTECGQGAVRKPKARPLRQGELPFCTDAHRARYHRRKSTDLQQISTEAVEKSAHGLS